MIGTSSEILGWIASDSKYANLLDMSRQRLSWLRGKLKQEGICEERKKEYFEKIKKNINNNQKGCHVGLSRVVCLRPRYTLPAVVCDHHGRHYLENALVKICSRSHDFDDLHLVKVCARLTAGGLPNKKLVRELLRRKGWNMVQERFEMPSVWLVE